MCRHVNYSPWPLWPCKVDQDQLVQQITSSNTHFCINNFYPRDLNHCLKKILWENIQATTLKNRSRSLKSAHPSPCPEKFGEHIFIIWKVITRKLLWSLTDRQTKDNTMCRHAWLWLKTQQVILTGRTFRLHRYMHLYNYKGTRVAICCH